MQRPTQLIHVPLSWETASHWLPARPPSICGTAGGDSLRALGTRAKAWPLRPNPLPRRRSGGCAAAAHPLSLHAAEGGGGVRRVLAVASVPHPPPTRACGGVGGTDSGRHAASWRGHTTRGRQRGGRAGPRVAHARPPVRPTLRCGHRGLVTGSACGVPLRRSPPCTVFPSVHTRLLWTTRPLTSASSPRERWPRTSSLPLHHTHPSRFASRRRGAGHGGGPHRRRRHCRDGRRWWWWPQRWWHPPELSPPPLPPLRLSPSPPLSDRLCPAAAAAAASAAAGASADGGGAARGRGRGRTPPAAGAAHPPPATASGPRRRRCRTPAATGTAAVVVTAAGHWQGRWGVHRGRRRPPGAGVIDGRCHRCCRRVAGSPGAGGAVATTTVVDGAADGTTDGGGGHSRRFGCGVGGGVSDRGGRGSGNPAVDAAARTATVGQWKRGGRRDGGCARRLDAAPPQQAAVIGRLVCRCGRAAHCTTGVGAARTRRGPAGRCVAAATVAVPAATIERGPTVAAVADAATAAIAVAVVADTAHLDRARPRWRQRWWPRRR